MDDLTRVLRLEGVPRWHQAHIFGQVTLVGTVLHVPDAEIEGFINRCYHDILCKHQWTVKVGRVASTPSKDASKAFKHVYTGKVDKPRQQDML
jgi:hypothetical protein